ncbi:Arc-like DNA binding domain-containing protein [Rhodoblastus acidophilus]|uniref:Arc-like DNA binding domain-containing protein n=1 Tax=Rhodoblastus acidophilus TaxID=1074 RepID=A0A212SHK4_RHOAC|nr:Arc family DNA-binding protein [Rhodoblastus acidophilus]SNB85065.1 Arc-like DNA binding domain-containing protein [Rhodoblastus acidophilus]
MRKNTHVRDEDKFMLCLPKSLRDRIAEAAKSNERSINNEIIAVLQHAYDQAAVTKYQTIVRSLARVDDMPPSLSPAKIDELERSGKLVEMKQDLKIEIAALVERIEDLDSDRDRIIARTERLKAIVENLDAAFHRS